MASREKFQKLLRSFSYGRQTSFWNLAQHAAVMWEELTPEQQQAAVDESPLAAIWKAGYEKGNERAIKDASDTLISVIQQREQLGEMFAAAGLKL